MKKIVMFMMMISTTAIAKPGVVVSEGSCVELKGTVARMYRSKVAGSDDQEIIRKCGATYLALILEKPIQVEVAVDDNGATKKVEVYRLSIHYRAKVNKELTKVSGCVDEIQQGTCNSEQFGIFGN
jgi:hypothetical protein